MYVVLRNASAYACILGVPIHFQDIRQKRRLPGLKQQHLRGLQLLTEISGGLLEGGLVGSQEILMQPGTNGITQRTFIVEQSAGSVCLKLNGTYSSSLKLVLQSALPVLLYAHHETTIVLKGRLDKHSSPELDYAKCILLPFLNRHFGIECSLDVRKRSLDEAELFITVTPLKRKLKCISLLERGKIDSFAGVIWNVREEYDSVESLSGVIESTVEQSARTSRDT